jgi:outer membrane lipoprotein SlyB
MILRKLSILGSISLLVMITACSSNPPRNEAGYNTPADTSQGVTFGNVSRIETVSKAASTSGGGAILGAVLGGVLGHQVGGGSGRDAATAVGVVGGAVIGNEVEKRNKNDGEIYRISVRLDNGRMVQFEYQRIDDLREGDRVKIQDGQLYRI